MDGFVVQTVIFLVVMLAGLFIIIIIMAGGKHEPVKKPDELNTEEAFTIYYNKKNSAFPILAVMAWLLLFMGLFVATSTDDKGLGIFLTVTAGTALVYVVYTVRNAKDDEDRILLRIDNEGIHLPEKRRDIPWDKVAGTEVGSVSNKSEHLCLYVINSSMKSGLEKVWLPVQFSRYGANYMEEVIALYMYRFR